MLVFGEMPRSVYFSKLPLPALGSPRGPGLVVGLHLCWEIPCPGPQATPERLEMHSPCLAWPQSPKIPEARFGIQVPRHPGHQLEALSLVKFTPSPTLYYS